MIYVALPGIDKSVAKRPYGKAYQTMPIKVYSIVTCVEEHFGITMDILCSPTRKREICYARQVLMYLLTQKTNLALKTIGDMFGGRDHTTVIHAKHTLNDLMETDETIRNEINELLSKF